MTNILHKFLLIFSILYYLDKTKNSISPNLLNLWIKLINIISNICWNSAQWEFYSLNMHIFEVFDIFCMKDRNPNHSNMYDNSMDVFEQFCNTLDTLRPVAAKIGHFFRWKEQFLAKTCMFFSFFDIISCEGEKNKPYQHVRLWNRCIWAFL